MSTVAWSEVEHRNPELAAHALARLDGIVYFATIRADGSPRVHPVGVTLIDGHLLVPMTPTSPKGKDLRRDNRFALHCTVEDNNGGGGEVQLSGVAREVPAPPAFVTSGWIAFELEIAEILSITHGDSGPAVTRWHPDARPSRSNKTDCLFDGDE